MLFGPEGHDDLLEIHGELLPALGLRLHFLQLNEGVVLFYYLRGEFIKLSEALLFLKLDNLKWNYF